MKIRTLARNEIGGLWSIDRTETIENVYMHESGRLVLRSEHHDVEDWPAGEPERDRPKVFACFDRGGEVLGAFDGERLVGGAVLDVRFMGRLRDRLQLMFLYVSRDFRNQSVGRALFERVGSRALELGALRLYVSATPSENTVRFYLRRGCRPTDDVDPELFALEPEDIHMEIELESAQKDWLRKEDQ